MFAAFSSTVVSCLKSAAHFPSRGTLPVHFKFFPETSRRVSQALFLSIREPTPATTTATRFISVQTASLLRFAKGSNSTFAALPFSTTMSTDAKPTGWSGSLTQEEFMMRDECILVDEADNINGHSNKYNCHRFVKFSLSRPIEYTPRLPSTCTT